MISNIADSLLPMGNALLGGFLVKVQHHKPH